MTHAPRVPPHRPRPHQLRRVPPSFVLPAPSPPSPEPRAAPVVPPVVASRHAQRRWFRWFRRLFDDAFWSGALTALSVADLVAVIVATV